MGPKIAVDYLRWMMMVGIIMTVEGIFMLLLLTHLHTFQRITIGLSTFAIVVTLISSPDTLLRRIVLVTSVEELRKTSTMAETIHIQDRDRSRRMSTLLTAFREEAGRRLAKQKLKLVGSSSSPTSASRNAWGSSSGGEDVHEFGPEDSQGGTRHQLLQGIFQMFDVDGTGAIDVDELHPMLSHIGLDLSQGDTQQVVTHFIDRDGKHAQTINLFQFIAIVEACDAHKMTAIEALKYLFGDITTGGVQADAPEASVSKGVLAAAISAVPNNGLQRIGGNCDLDWLLRDADKRHDGEIQLGELAAMMAPGE